jgi:hypothetical protein
LDIGSGTNYHPNFAICKANGSVGKLSNVSPPVSKVGKNPITVSFNNAGDSESVGGVFAEVLAVGDQFT